ncbi:MAG: WG repeat-containing protein [Mobilitalea sp.]
MKRILSMLLVIMLLISIVPVIPVEAATQTITYLTKAVYDSVSDYSEGLVWVQEGNTFKYLNEKGKVVIDLSNKKYAGKNESIYSVGDFHDGLALIVVQKDSEDDYDLGGYYIDKKGNIALTTAQVNKKQSGKSKISGLYYNFSQGITLTDARPDVGKVALVKTDGSTKWITADTAYYWYTQDLLCVGSYVDGEYLWGYVDKNYKKVISYKFNQARPFNNNLAPVEINGKWGFIDKSGKTVIKAQFDDFIVHDSNASYVVFDDGLATVLKNNKWGVIDKKGNTVIAFKYDYPVIFRNGYACVAGSDGKYTYIDKKGKTVIKTGYEDANYFTKTGVAVVGNNGVYKLIDTKGKQIGKKTWKFDGTKVSGMAPDILRYEIDGKYGIAKVG